MSEQAGTGLPIDVCLRIVQAVLPGMRERGWGRIINMSSLVVLGMAERTAYAASKSAMMSLHVPGHSTWRVPGLP
jgi:3-oxoacyl-[acyl-carrier protein] reductase